MSEEMKKVFSILRSFWLNADLEMFFKIFGKDMGQYYWEMFNDKNRDVIAFINHLDDAYKQVLLNFLITGDSKNGT